MRRRRARPPSLAPLLLALAVTIVASPAAATGSVAGVVYLEDGSPAGGASVTLSPGSFNTTTAADGSFRVEVPAGNYSLVASTLNASAVRALRVEEGRTTALVLQLAGPSYTPGPVNLFPFVFLALSMIAVAAGGFYVNKRMAETGIDFNKSVLGGAPARKPFRRRRKRAPPPPAP